MAEKEPVLKKSKKKIQPAYLFTGQNRQIAKYAVGITGLEPVTSTLSR